MIRNHSYGCTLSMTYCCSLPTYRCAVSGSSATAHFLQRSVCREGTETSQALHNPGNSIATTGMYFCTRQNKMTWGQSLPFFSLIHTHIHTHTNGAWSAKCAFFIPVSRLLHRCLVCSFCILESMFPVMLFFPCLSVWICIFSIPLYLYCMSMLLD